MEKKKGWRNKYLYFLISIVLLILIVAEVSQIDNYHSSYESLNVKIINLNQTDYIIIAKLPGVSVHSIMYLSSFSPLNHTISPVVPVNTSVSSISLENFKSTRYLPSITVEFNSTSSSRSTVSFDLNGTINPTLSNSNPVYVNITPASMMQNLHPGIVQTPQYDYMVIQVNNILTVECTEVSK